LIHNSWNITVIIIIIIIIIITNTTVVSVLNTTALMDHTGVVWDAYTMDRWTDPARTDLMEQQSAWEQGKPWVKLNDMGTNMKQVVSGPDGNKMAAFEGKLHGHPSKL
jgi:hypothetical protein